MKKVIFCCLGICIAFLGFAEIPKEHKLWLAVDGAYYPFSQSEVNLSGGSSFVPLAGPFSGLELRGTLYYNYVVPLRMGTHPLVADSKIEFGGGLELTPVSVEPFIGITFTPVPFLVFNLGGAGGTGWDFSPLGVQGLALYDGTDITNAYRTYPAFTQFHYRAWLQGTFQFDLAAVVPGEWNHVVALASYRVYYEGVAGAGKRPWIWQGRGSTFEERVNTWKYYSAVVLGYQMPLVLQMVGFQAEFWGNYLADAYEEKFQRWNPTFMTVTLSPFLNFKITKKQSLLVQFRFANRRSFNKEYNARTDSRLALIERDSGMYQTGMEWFFERIALSYNIQF